MATALTAFHSWITPFVPGAPADQVTTYLREVVIDFCKRTMLIQQELASLDVTSGTAEYSLTMPSLSSDVCPTSNAATYSNACASNSGLTLVQIPEHGARFSTSPTSADTFVPLKITSRLDLTMLEDGTDWRTETGVPVKFYVHPEMEIIGLYPAPSSDGTGALKVWAALRPNDSATFVPDVLYNEWRRPLADGCKAMLASMPGTTWHQPELAQAWADSYEYGVKQAILNLITSQQGKPVRTKRYGV